MLYGMWLALKGASTSLKSVLIYMLYIQTEIKLHLVFHLLQAATSPTGVRTDVCYWLVKQQRCQRDIHTNTHYTDESSHVYTLCIHTFYTHYIAWQYAVYNTYIYCSSLDKTLIKQMHFNGIILMNIINTICPRSLYRRNWICIIWRPTGLNWSFQIVKRSCFMFASELKHVGSWNQHAHMPPHLHPSVCWSVAIPSFLCYFSIYSREEKSGPSQPFVREM